MTTVEREKVGYHPAFTRPGEAEALVVPQQLPESELPRPHLDYDVRRGVWRLEADYAVQDGECTLTIPKGFTLDLASIPRALWLVMSSIDLGLVGPLAHDFLYWIGGHVENYTEPKRRYTRHEADRLFAQLMQREGVPFWKRKVAYRAVRWFGWTHF